MKEEWKKALNVRYVKLHFVAEVSEDCILPVNKTSAIRGGMGEMLLRFHCVRDRQCEACDFAAECIVQRIMYSKFEKKPFFVTQGESIGYVLECEDYREVFKRGETFPFNLIIFGKEIVYLNQFMQAFCMLGMEGIGKNHAKFRIISVTNTKRYPLLVDGIVYMENYEIMTIRDYVDYRVEQLRRQGLKNEILFKTPLTLKYRGEFLREFQMEAIMEAVIRRIYMLDCYEGIEEDVMQYEALPVPEIIAQEVWKAQVRRYSTRQQSGMVLQGIEGKIDLNRIGDESLPVLLAGELVHIGKNSRFGFGRYKIK